MYKNFISITYSSLDILFPNELVEASMYAGEVNKDVVHSAGQYKNAKTVPVILDEIINPLFSCRVEGNAYTALVFSKNLFSPNVVKEYGSFTKKSSQGYFSFLTAGETRVVNLNLAQFSVLHGITGKSLIQKGFSAVRFTPEGRIQFLADFNKILTALLER